jgi:hypothetical protein
MTIKTRKLVFSALLAAPLMLALDLRSDVLSFHPEAGSSVDKELAITGAMYIDDILLNVDGEEMPAEMLGEITDMAFEFEASEEVTDQYVKSGDGRALVLLRTFNDVAISLTAGGESQEPEIAEIIDSTVKFTWNEEEEEYEIAYEEGSGDDEDLEGLDVDMDFTYLLPEGEVKEGATWEVVGMDAARIFLPGGTITGPADGLDEDFGIGELADEILTSQIEDALEEFTVDCTYMGTDDEGETQITFEFEGELSLDFSELVMAVLEEQDMGGMEIDADITLTIDIEMEGKGTLTWDTEAGRASGFEMAADIMILLDAGADIEAAGEAHTAEGTVELSGELEYEMSVD